MKKVDYLPIINKSESYKVELNDVCYIERENRKVKLVTDWDEIRTYDKIENMERYFQGRSFVKCMEGIIINISKIKSMRNSQVMFDNGMSVALGRDGFIKAKQCFNAYLRGLRDDL